MLESFAHFFFALGGLGLLLLGILDSSFLILPIGNDLLIVALTAETPGHLGYYVVMATLGSGVGVSIMHWASSRMGQKAIQGDRKSRQVAYVESKVASYGGLAIAFAALAPPGFPFTLFIVVSAALQYPRLKMVAIVMGCRLLRFSIEAWLAIVYGTRILQMAKSPAIQKGIIGLVLISTVGSAFSIWNWVKRGRAKR
ncbi:MAG: hypothetical protein ABJC09_13830 [Terriglobia bacterium]